MSYESNFDFQKFARLLQKAGVINKSIMEMSKEEILKLIESVYASAKYQDVPF